MATPMQADAGALQGHLRAAAQGHAHVGLGQGRAVVDAVAGHDHEFALALQRFYEFQLVRRTLTRPPLLNAKGFRHRPRVFLAVAGGHDYFHIGQGRQRRRSAGFNFIADPEGGCPLAGDGEEDAGAFYFNVPFRQQLLIAEQYFLAGDDPSEAAAGDCVKIAHRRQG